MASVNADAYWLPCDLRPRRAKKTISLGVQRMAAADKISAIARAIADRPSNMLMSKDIFRATASAPMPHHHRLHIGRW